MGCVVWGVGYERISRHLSLGQEGGSESLTGRFPEGSRKVLRKVLIGLQKCSSEVPGRFPGWCQERSREVLGRLTPKTIFCVVFPFVFQLFPWADRGGGGR